MGRTPRKGTWAGAGALAVALLVAYLNGGMGGVLGELASLEALAPPPSGAGAPISTNETTTASLRDDAEKIGELFRQRISGEVVESQGRVRATLRDDNRGARHQLFLVDIAGGQTLLISHNIDLAPRIDGLEQGDQVAFRGQYEWNEKGGVVHWTHRDPGGQRPGGWIRYAGSTYR